MTDERWCYLMDYDSGKLTAQEIADGWHFCPDWDGLLIGPGTPELESCNCPKETYQEWSERRCRENPCDICGGDACETHHIARGQNKRNAKRAVFAVLHVCRPCHDLKVHQGMPVAEQLAYILLRRDSEFDMPKFYKLTGRVWPSLEDINHAHAELSMITPPNTMGELRMLAAGLGITLTEPENRK